MSSADSGVRFLPEALFTPKLVEELHLKSGSLEELMGHVARLPSVGAVVARKDAAGNFLLKGRLRDSSTTFRLLDGDKNRWFLKFGHTAFSRILEFDRFTFFLKLYPLGATYGCKNGCTFKAGLSQQLPLASVANSAGWFMWSGLHEHYARSRVGLKGSWLLEGLKAYLFTEHVQPLGQNYAAEGPARSGLKLKFKVDATRHLRPAVPHLVRGGFKLVHPVFGFSDDNEWHLRVAQLQRVPSGWLFHGSVLEVESVLNASNKFHPYLYLMRGVSGTATVTDERDRFNVQSFLNLKLRRDPRTRKPDAALDAFAFASLFVRDYRVAKAAAGAGVELFGGEGVTFEFLLNFFDLDFLVRVAKD